MSKKLFTNEEILALSKNKYVKRVGEKGITYTDEFKSLFVAERSMGKLPIQIFQDTGFDVNVLGNTRIWCATLETSCLNLCGHLLLNKSVYPVIIIK